MSLKQIYTWVAIGAGSLIVLGAGAANAATFTRAQYTPNDMLDFRALGYTYDNFDTNTVATVAPGVIIPNTLQVRRNITSLSPDELTRYVNAVTTLKNTMVTTTNGVQISVYDQFVATHLGAMDLAGRPGPNGQPLVNAAHGNAGFLPWHRAFIYEFEKQLQTVDSSVTIPYWDPTNATQTTALFSAGLFGSRNTGAGGLIDGRFAGWQQRNDLSGNTWLGTQSGSRNLRRASTQNINTFTTNMQTVSTAALNQAVYLNAANTGGFNRPVELSIHNPMHTFVGGSMNFMTSPNDPVFWLLHAGIDRLWSRWQVAVADTPTTGRLTGTAAYATPGVGTPYGHGRLDAMWPWDNGQSRVAADLAALLPTLPGVSPIDPGVLAGEFMMASAPSDLSTDVTGNMYNPWGHHAYHGDQPCPDIVANLPCDKPCHNGSSVPEPASIFGLLTFGALGAGSLRKRKLAKAAN
ncbi:tyrosinase family protein [Ancylothrix sp. C2]|uniref:tyrosinase family protein n=1 Tax=Ancylothrix sp. D3o TaxID=2953691 RepID=UPI0021BAEA37|nr:tyrosinase family protein [Ancylothrix sp. D3o]MCT7948800.1 tyrosinase family protein [Ancylothrix sp. D3o]